MWGARTQVVFKDLKYTHLTLCQHLKRSIGKICDKTNELQLARD